MPRREEAKIPDSILDQLLAGVGGGRSLGGARRRTLREFQIHADYAHTPLGTSYAVKLLLPAGRGAAGTMMRRAAHPGDGLSRRKNL